MTRTQRYAIGVTADDLPTTIPAEVKLQALDLLRSKQYFVYIGSPKAPARIRNQWLVTTFGHDGPELLTRWAEHYYSFRQAYDMWQQTC